VRDEIVKPEPPPRFDNDEGVRLQDYWRVLKKRFRLILLLFVSTVGTTAAIAFSLTPSYTAGATLLIEPQTPQVLDLRDVLAQPLGPDEYDYYKTQYEILRSYSLAARVIHEQHLDANPWFTGKERTFTLSRVWLEVKDALRSALFSSMPPPVGEYPLGVSPELVERYLKTLEVRPIQGTRLVRITFDSPHPETAALVANAHAEAYIQQGVELRTRTNEEARSFLEGKLAELRARAEKSETALNSYRRSRKMISPDDKENLIVGRLTDLNRRLTEAEVEKIALEAQVRVTRATSEDLPGVTDNKLVQTLKEQLTRTKNEYASLAVLYQPGYPRLEQLKVQIEETQARVDREIRQMVKSVEAAYRAADAKAKELRARVEEQRSAALKLKDAAVDYAILAREVDTNRQLYDSVLQRIKEMGLQAALSTSNVSFVDRAVPPLLPAKPRKTLSLLIGAVIGVIGGVGLAFLSEYLDNTLKTPQEVERFVQAPTLGIVPDFTSEPLRRQLTPTASRATPASEASAKELLLSYHPLSLITEAYRTLRSSILLSRAGEPPRTLLVTSSTKGEGKTVTALNTAIVLAQMGARVLVIDADLRQSRCHKILHAENGRGLTEFLSGHAELAQVIRATSTKQLSFISAGSTPPNPADLLGSERMRTAVQWLSRRYDYVLIDSPPVMLASDAVLLSTIVDGVVLVVNSQHTPGHIVKEARARLDYARAKILGAVINKVDITTSDYAGDYHAYYS
jgi:capsular exopolysaccharide synthesis family protein